MCFTLGLSPNVARVLDELRSGLKCLIEALVTT